MPFLVETGAGVAGANSLVSVAYARDYAALRGLSLPADDAALQPLLIRATDYLRGLSFVGTKTYPGAQYLPWPRSGILVDDVELSASTVPAAILDAASQLAVEQASGVDISPTTLTGSAIKRERIGTLETEYAVNSGGSGRAVMTTVRRLLAGFVTASPSGILHVGRG